MNAIGHREEIESRHTSLPEERSAPATCATGKARETLDREAIEASLPSPDEVRAVFDEFMAAGDPEGAVAYLHALEEACGYLKGGAGDVIAWTGEGPYGPLELTINLAKPEKDPRAIAAAAAGSSTSELQNGVVVAPTAHDTPASDMLDDAPAPGLGTLASNPAFVSGSGIPQCDLCWENEGFPGAPGHPAKPGLRVAAIPLGGERWGLQFSPYAYFPEHCIALAAEHRPMVIDGSAVERLLDFVDLFPFYFVGSNADLPIVGGSILSHDHYQGGRHEFPLMRAPVEQPFALPGLPEVTCGVVRWPATTLRLRSRNRTQLAEAARRVMAAWRDYSDPSVGIATPHNTLNPIVRKLGDEYVLDLVLRNNCTTPERPWGLFHPDESLHHIKKENIGLIEIMGLAILPPRLARELPAVQRALHEAVLTGKTPEVLTGKTPKAFTGAAPDALAGAAPDTLAGATPDALEASLAADPLTAAHAPWAADILARRRADLAAEAEAIASGLWTQTSPSLVKNYDIPNENGQAEGVGTYRLCIAPGQEKSTVDSGVNNLEKRDSGPMSSVFESKPLSEAARRGRSDVNPLAPVLQSEVSAVYERILEATGVFKRDPDGRAALDRFLRTLGAL